MGDDILPAVDNVNTFDTTLTVLANYHSFSDQSRNLITDYMALGQITDPVFGSTTANMFFNLSSAVYGSSPFYNRDSVLGIDSVVLSLAYTGAYGDTSSASLLDVSVSEINADNGFVDTVLYRYDTLGFSTGPSLGTKSFSVKSLRDTLSLIRKTDTTKVANVLRVRLDNSLGTKLSQYDTTGNGAYKNDSLFRAAFRGLAVKVTNASNPGTLAYFNVSGANSGLTVYYRASKSGVIDTASASFVHNAYSQANSVLRTAGGEYSAGLDAASSQKLYIQSSPSGSYAGITIPGLNGFPNKVIHRAELIAFKLPSTMDNVFWAPNRLLLDHKGTSDTARVFDNDIPFDATGSLSLDAFGGTLRNGGYRFNITRYVQGIVTRKEPNDTLRLYAPLRNSLYSKTASQYVSVPVLFAIGYGREVLAGSNYPDPALQIRLRIVYSNL